MSRSKAAPARGEASDSSHSSGRLSLKFDDEASYRAKNEEREREREREFFKLTQ